MLNTFYEEQYAIIGVISFVLYFVFLIILSIRISSMRASGRIYDFVPAFFTVSPLKNARALIFIYFASPWKFRDYITIMCFYVVRLSFVATIGFFVLALFSRVGR